MPELQSCPDPLDISRNEETAPRASRRAFVFQPDPPPRAIVRLGQAAGAVEGLIAGWIYGGFAAIPLSVLFGSAIGAIIGVLAWRIRRRARSFILPFVFGLAIEALGGVIIVLAARMNAPKALDRTVTMLLAAAFALPFGFLYLRLIHREVIAAYRGLIAGVTVGAIGFGVLMGAIAAEGFGGIAAIMLFILGGVGGALMGCMVGLGLGPLIGGLVGVFANVTRTSFAPTFGGLAAAIGFVLTGFYAGGAIAGGLGSFMGIALGVVYGTILGIKLGKLATPYLLTIFAHNEDKDPNLPPVLDLGSARQLADADPTHLALAEMLLLAVCSHFRRIHLEEWENNYIATLLMDDSSSPYSWPLPLYPSTIQILKDLTRIEPGENCQSIEPQEGHFQLRLQRHRLDVSVIYQSDKDGERIDLRWNADLAAAKRAEKISNTLQFILKSRRQFTAQVIIGREVA